MAKITAGPEIERLVHLLARLPGWRQAYADEAAVIFVRERRE